MAGLGQVACSLPRFETARGAVVCALTRRALAFTLLCCLVASRYLVAPIQCATVPPQCSSSNYNNYIFVTQETYNGNLGGLFEERNRKCTFAANATGSVVKQWADDFYAVLPEGDSNPGLVGVGAIHIIPPFACLLNTNGSVVAGSKRELSVNGSQAVILDQFGNTVSGYAWTGAQPDGESISGYTCAVGNFYFRQATTGNGRIGDPNIIGSDFWSRGSVSEQSCSTSQHIYCTNVKSNCVQMFASTMAVTGNSAVLLGCNTFKAASMYKSIKNSPSSFIWLRGTGNLGSKSCLEKFPKNHACYSSGWSIYTDDHHDLFSDYTPPDARYEKRIDCINSQQSTCTFPPWTGCDEFGDLSHTCHNWTTADVNITGSIGGESPSFSYFEDFSTNSTSDCLQLRSYICVEMLSSLPTASPSLSPTLSPVSPTLSPTHAPTQFPSLAPTVSPTPTAGAPTKSPTASPTTSPTRSPSSSPSLSPTQSPTTFPSLSPTLSPTESPLGPTISPTASPTRSPSSTLFPTLSPTNSPTTTTTTTSSGATTTAPAGGSGGSGSSPSAAENIFMVGSGTEPSDSSSTLVIVAVLVVLAVVCAAAAAAAILILRKQRNAAKMPDSGGGGGAGGGGGVDAKKKKKWRGGGDGSRALSKNNSERRGGGGGGGESRRRSRSASVKQSATAGSVRVPLRSPRGGGASHGNSAVYPSISPRGDTSVNVTASAAAASPASHTPHDYNILALRQASAGSAATSSYEAVSISTASSSDYEQLKVTPYAKGYALGVGGGGSGSGGDSEYDAGNRFFVKLKNQNDGEEGGHVAVSNYKSMHLPSGAPESVYNPLHLREGTRELPPNLNASGYGDLPDEDDVESMKRGDSYSELPRTSQRQYSVLAATNDDGDGTGGDGVRGAPAKHHYEAGSIKRIDAATATPSLKKGFSRTSVEQIDAAERAEKRKSRSGKRKSVKQ